MNDPMPRPIQPPGPMNCSEFVEVVTDYIEKALAESERLRVDAHLDGCDGCQAYLDQMKRTVAMLRKLADGDLPDDLRTD